MYLVRIPGIDVWRCIVMSIRWIKNEEGLLAAAWATREPDKPVLPLETVPSVPPVRGSARFLVGESHDLRKAA